MTWREGVVPVTVEFMRSHSQSCKFRIGYLDAFFITVLIECRLDSQSTSRLGIRYQVYNCLTVHQGMTPPVLRNEAEESMLDLVPFAGAGRKVTHKQRQPDLVGKLL